MRLKNIYKILKEVEPIIIKIKVESVGGSSSDSTIKNWNEILKSIGELKDIKVFESIGQELFNVSPIFAENTNTLRMTASLTNSFNIWLNKLKTKINVIIELCESLGYGSNEGSFEIKLPETKNFDEFATNVDNLNKAIQICPFIKFDDSDVRLTKTDIGSTWLEFIIIGTNSIAALTALGYFTQSALKIKSMYLTCEQQKEAVRGAQIKNNLAEDITDMYKNIVKATAENEIKNIEEKLGKSLSPEERNSAEKSLDILGKLMSKGLEIYATLDSPQEAKDVFPNIQQQNTLSGIPKMLTDSSNEGK